MKTKYKIYYSLLIVVLLGMIGRTIFVGSQYIAYGQEVHQLEQQKKVALAKAQDLHRQIDQENSIATLADDSQAQGYTPITKLVQVQVEHATQVAMR